MTARLLTATTVLLLACAPGGDPGERCVEEPPTTARCCSPAVYEPVTATEFAEAPGAFVGRRVEIVGSADWFTGGASNDCACAGGICSCIRPLILRSFACPAEVELGGSFGGRPVECGDEGCWPLQLLQSYAVCGVGAQDPQSITGFDAILQVEAFCER